MNIQQEAFFNDILFVMDYVAKETEFSNQQISHMLAEAIKDADGIDKSPKLELLTAGADSHIYCVKPSGEDAQVAKLYDVSSITLEEVQKYADKTNWLKSNLRRNPYIAEVVLYNESWVVQFAINEVKKVGVVAGYPYTVSPYVEGDDFEKMVIAAKSDQRKPYVMVSSNSGVEYPFSTQSVLDLQQQTFDMENPNRLEIDFNRHMNSVLKSRQFNVQPLNLKVRADVNSRNITFFVTDIAGTVSGAVRSIS